MDPPETDESRLLAIVPAGEAGAVREAGEAAGFSVEIVQRLSEGLQRVARGGWEVVLLSLSVEHADLATARRLAEQPHVPVLLLSGGPAGLDLSLNAVRAGARTLLREPLEVQRLTEELQRASTNDAGVALPEAAEPGDRTPLLVGTSAVMARVFELLGRVADTPATVLVTGESGTGKELVARALHQASARRRSPFVAVNCAAIPEHLLESELFGHERGAFTGAVALRPGRFERAHGGTLFLDEIGDMSLVLQAKILRALEEREVERVGGTGVVPVDVRVVAATHRALPERIRSGEFREDLYYRLAVFRVELPPLRERLEDLDELALHFAADFARRYGRPVRAISEAALKRLRSHDWPGNVRELRNVMDRAVLLCPGSALAPEDLLLGEDAPRFSPREIEPFAGYPPTFTLAEVEARHIERVLDRTSAHMGEAARILGIHRNTLTRKVREYGLQRG